MRNDFKKQELLNDLEMKVFTPIEIKAKELNNQKLLKGVRLTRIRMNQLPDGKAVLKFFWSAITGTNKSIKFYNLLYENNLPSFESILVEIREKYTDNYMNS